MGIEAIQQKPVTATGVNKKHSPKVGQSEITIPIGQKKPEKTEQTNFEKIEKNVVNDLKSGVLTREDGYKILGIFKVDDDYMVYHADKVKRATGKMPTYGDIKARYGLKAGDLRKSNNLTFVPGDKDARGNNVDLYRPDEIDGSNVRIQLKLMEKYLKAK